MGRGRRQAVFGAAHPDHNLVGLGDLWGTYIDRLEIHPINGTDPSAFRRRPES